MRERIVPPKFFTDHNLADTSFESRFCLIGLWTMADREGRLEFIPAKIKRALFAFDTLSIEDVRNVVLELEDKKFLIIFEAAETQFIQIKDFKAYQRPVKQEQDSIIPCYFSGCGKVGTCYEHNPKILKQYQKQEFLFPDETEEKPKKKPTRMEKFADKAKEASNLYKTINSKALSDGRRNYARRLDEGGKHKDLMKAIKHYIQHIQSKKKYEFIYQMNNFFGLKQYFNDWINGEELLDKPDTKVINKQRNLANSIGRKISDGESFMITNKDGESFSVVKGSIEGIVAQSDDHSKSITIRPFEMDQWKIKKVKNA